MHPAQNGGCCAGVEKPSRTGLAEAQGEMVRQHQWVAFDRQHPCAGPCQRDRQSLPVRAVCGPVVTAVEGRPRWRTIMIVHMTATPAGAAPCWAEHGRARLDLLRPASWL